MLKTSELYEKKESFNSENSTASDGFALSLGNGYFQTHESDESLKDFEVIVTNKTSIPRK